VVVTDDLRSVLSQRVNRPLHLQVTRSAPSPHRDETKTYVGSELERENRSIDNPDVLQAVHLQLGIDDTSLVTRQHSKGVRGMELGDDTAGNKRVDRVVSSDGRTRRGLCTKDVLQWGGSCDLPGKLNALPQHHHIGLMGQVLRIEGGVVEGIVGGDV